MHVVGARIPNMEKMAERFHFWKKLRNQEKNARRTPQEKHKKETKFQLSSDYLCVQRLSAAVSGKAQKFSRVGPCEFVPFNRKDDATLESIKQACMVHWSNKIGPGFICDVHAGERGPSCQNIEHVSDLKLVHVRFIQKFHRIRGAIQTQSGTLNGDSTLGGWGWGLGPSTLIS